MRAFVETKRFNELSVKFGLDSQIDVDFCKIFASHTLISLKKSGTVIMNVLKMFAKKTCLLVMRYEFTLLSLFCQLFTLKKVSFPVKAKEHYIASSVHCFQN